MEAKYGLSATLKQLANSFTAQQARKIISTATTVGRVSAAKIDPPTTEGTYGGKTVAKIKKGAGVSDVRVMEIFKYMISLGSWTNPVTGQAEAITEETLRQALREFDAPPQRKTAAKKAQTASLANRLAILESENQSLKERLVRLETELDTKIDARLEGKLDTRTSAPVETKPRARGTIKGFSLNFRKTGGNEYYWYAGRVIDGKKQWIYVGKDDAVADVKIDAWLQKHPEIAAKAGL